MVESMSECPTIYLVNIPLKPRDKVEIQQLQTALIVATLSVPRIFEDLDPVERVLFIDNLYVATAALAREKAGYSISQIAEELGRSEVIVRAHLSGATKVGRIVREVYESLSRSNKEELTVRRVDITVVTDREVAKFMEIIKRLESENNKLRERIRELEEKIKDYETRLWKISSKISEILKEVG